MTALSIAAVITVVVIGLILIAELVAVTMLLMRVAGLTKQLRGKLTPVIDETTQILHKANDIASTVKTDTQRVADTVTGVTEHLAGRVDRASSTMESVTNSALQRLTSPPVMTAMALFAGLQMAPVLRRVVGWPLALISLLAGVPFGVRAWRSVQQARTGTAPAEERTPLVLRAQPEEEMEVRRAA